MIVYKKWVVTNKKVGSCKMKYLGNKDLLKLHKTGFLSSRRCPAEVVLKSYKWAKQQREEGVCIVCGNHSKIEKDVFEILLRGDQPLILVLGRSLYKRNSPEINEALRDNRLLIISPFDKEVKRLSKESASARNKYILELCDSVVIGFSSKNGKLKSEIEQYLDKVSTLIFEKEQSI